MAMMLRSVLGIGFAGVLVAGAMMGLAQQEAAKPGTAVEAVNAGIPAGISDAAFLAGRWQGKMGKNKDSFVEEVWTEPNGKNALGMFRWLKPDGTPMVLEQLWINEEDGTLLLRLRHQSGAGVAWEEKDKPLVFALAEKSATMMKFDALRDCGDLAYCKYETKDGKLLIDVVFGPPSKEAAEAGKKQRPALRFELDRKTL